MVVIMQFLDMFFGLFVVVGIPIVLTVLYRAEKRHSKFREPTEYLERIKNSLE